MQCYKGVGRREAGRGGQGWGGGEGGGKTPQVKTRDHQSPPDGPDHSTRPEGTPFRSRVELQAGYTPIGALHRCQCVGHGFTRL